MMTPEVRSDTGDEPLLVYGAGLIGSSLAAAWRLQWPTRTIVAVERDAAHRRQALGLGCFTQVVERSEELASQHFAVAVLAVPTAAACELLADAAKRATVVMDVCSVKQPLCDQAVALHLQQVFAPTHPMAGVAVSGPAAADAHLFCSRPWIVLDGWSATARILSLLAAVGATVRRLPSAAAHDDAMAAVSHGVHLTSLATMLAGQDAAATSHARWGALCGPAFWDITRLSTSPSEFWRDALFANQVAVTAQIDRVIARLLEFREALQLAHSEPLTQLLDDARAARYGWEQMRNDDSQAAEKLS